MRTTEQDIADRERQLTRDVEVVRRSLAQHKAGDSKELHVFFDEVRAKLIATKIAQENGSE